MRRILNSCFEESNEGYYDFLIELDNTNTLYEKDYKIKILVDQEVEFVQFMTSSYEKAKIMPSRDLFINNFDEIPGMENAFDGIPILDIKDFRVYMYNFISKRVNKVISKEIMKINQSIDVDGLTEERMERINELYRISNLHKAKKVEIDYDYQAAYLDKISRPVGMMFNIKELDEKLFGLDLGSMTTIAGFTSHFKSTMTMNMAYHNVYQYGYNVLYITLETPKEDMYWNLLSRHSQDMKFGDKGISHEKIRKCELTEEEQKFIFEEVDADFRSAKGKLVILDETDFNTMSFPEIYSIFESVDDALGGELDAFVVDYIQLLKFSGGSSGDDNRTINSYVSFFRRMTQSFRDKKLIGVLLSQINRDSWKRASRNDGRYDLTCLADANELERGSHRVVTIYTTETLKASREARLQILKNRYGQTMYDSAPVYADGERYIVGEEMDGFGSPVASVGGSLEEAFDSLDFDDIDKI